MAPRSTLLSLAALAGAALAARPAAEALSTIMTKSGPPASWAPQACAAFLTEVGFSSATAEAVVAQGVTGDLLADWADLDALAITGGADKVRWKTVQRALEAAASAAAAPRPTAAAATSSQSGPSSDHNLWHLRDMDRWGFYSTMGLLVTNTRATLWYLHTHNAETGEPNAVHFFDGHPESAKFNVVEWLLLPELTIVRHISGFMDTNPIYAVLLIGSMLLAAVVNAIIYLRILNKGGVPGVLAIIGVQNVLGAALYAFSWLFWRITPSFMINLGLYIFPISMAAGSVVGLKQILDS